MKDDKFIIRALKIFAVGIVGIVIIACIYPETTSFYQKGYQAAMQEVEKNNKIDSLDALYWKLFKDDIRYTGIWEYEHVEANRCEIDRIFSELCNMKAGLK